MIYQKINDEKENEELNKYYNIKLHEIIKFLAKISDYLINVIYSLYIQKYFYLLQVELCELNNYWNTNLQIHNFSEIEKLI